MIRMRLLKLSLFLFFQFFVAVWSYSQSVTPVFDQVYPICKFSSSPLQSTSNNGVTGIWTPAFDNSNTTEYTFIPDAGQDAFSIKMTVIVIESITPTFDPLTFCVNDLLAELPTVSKEGIPGTWRTPLNKSAIGQTTYLFDVDFSYNPYFCPEAPGEIVVTVIPGGTPRFDQIPPICNNDAVTLPLTSNNAVSGTWDPATVNDIETTTYTFTPDGGGCTTQMTIEVGQNTPTFTGVNAIPTTTNSLSIVGFPTTSDEGYTGTWTFVNYNEVISKYTFTSDDLSQCVKSISAYVTLNYSESTFDPIGPFCEGDTSITTLPLTSVEGHTGTWNPATIDKTIVGTTTYTFTPDAGQLTTTTSVDLDITVNTQIIPDFSFATVYCESEVVSAFPLISDNGVEGTWNSISVDTSVTGTTTYTFTPKENECSEIFSVEVTVNPLVIAEFNEIGEVYIGDTTTTLPNANNGVSGTWNPSTIDSSTAGIYTYEFTPAIPNTILCAATNTYTMTIEVKTPVTPSFVQVAPICIGETLEELPTTSLNSAVGNWTPALNNTLTTEYTFTPTGPNASEYTQTTMTITVNPIVTPVFTEVGTICAGEPLAALPKTSTNGITGVWSPALDNTQTTTYTFTPNDASQCGTQTTMTITVNPIVTPVFTEVGTICAGEPLAALPTISTNGITGIWNPALDNTQTTTYTFTPDDASQCGTQTTMTITVNPIVTPTFTEVGTVCAGEPLAALPTTSTNGITGVWSPALDNTQTTTYTFTPDDASQCATQTTMTITVTPIVTPIFTQVGTICDGEPLAALPTISTNGITGVWNPALDNTQTTTYTFIPDDASQCATQTTMTITVNPIVTPTFTEVGTICAGEPLAALPTTSTNGITGVWSPALDNTQTTTYTFTPDDASQCATQTTMTITVTPIVTPIFNTITTTICIDDTPNLPMTSNNGVTGVWTNTSTTGTIDTYTFTPDAGQCAESTNVNITITPKIIPTFSFVTNYCQSDVVSDSLPLISDNGIEGTWNTASINTSIIGNTTYIFTPNINQCAEIYSTVITVTPLVVAMFDEIGEVYEGDTTTVLPTANNGVNGTWDPATINSDVLGSPYTYTFTPAIPNDVACASTAIVTMTIEVKTPATPSFAQVAPICFGESLEGLPTTSLNGATGTWNPALDNTQTTTYTFTPTDIVRFTTTTMTIEVNPIVTPTFSFATMYCKSDNIADNLPLISDNDITGTWNAVVINTSSVGMSSYTFTPHAGQCAENTNVNITITPKIIPTFSFVTNYCESDVVPDNLPLISDNGIEGTWNTASIDTSITGNTSYTFTPNEGECAESYSTVITITPLVIAMFNEIGEVYLGDTTTTLPVANNGVNGTWNPSSIDSSTEGTYTYEFTPVIPNDVACASSNIVTMTIEVKTPATPSFVQVAPICFGESLEELPTTSLNSATGTWSPALDNTQTITYTFTPTDIVRFTTATMTIEVNPLPIATEPLEALVLCDDNEDGAIQGFNLTSKSTEILGTQTIGYEVTFYDDGGILITTPEDYTNTSNPQTITARVTNNTTNCYAETTFQLIVNPLPTATQPSEAITICDNDVNGFVDGFNLTSKRNEILGIQTTGYEVTYYDNRGALISNPTDYTNNSNPQTITARVTNTTTNCYAETTFQLIVNPFPEATQPTEGITLCDDDTDGFVGGFNLISKSTEILGLQGTGYTVAYYDASGTLIENAVNYTNSSNPQTITARVTNTSTNCYTETTFELMVAPLPTATRPLEDIAFCDDDTDGFVGGFDLTSKSAEILGSQTTGYTVSYYDSSETLIINPTNYTNTANPQTITARVTNDDTNCYTETTFQLIVNSLPIINQPSDIELCDDGAISGEKEFDLTLRTSQILSSEIIGYEVTYYNADMLITNPTMYTNISNPQTITARVTNTITNCYTETTFQLIVSPLAIANTADNIEICDDASDGSANNGFSQSIDLSVQTATILGSQDPTQFSVSYHISLENAENGIFPLNTSSYSNAMPFTETIYARTFNTISECSYAISTFDIIVYASPTVLLTDISNLSLCDDATDLDDTNGVVQNFDLTAQASDILKNYDASLHSNFTISYHRSQAHAETGDSPITDSEASQYQNTPQPDGSPERIYIRVTNIDTGCVNADTYFDLIVNPLPDFEVTTPQIVCLNDTPLLISAENPQGLYDYQWIRVDDDTVVGNNQDLEVYQGGTYKITATNTTTGCSRFYDITVNESNPAVFTLEDITIVDDSDNNTISINTTNLGIGDYEYALTNEQGDFVKNYQDTPVFENLEGGIYTILIRDKNGCDVAGVPTLTVPVIEYPKFFTPNNDGVNDTWFIKGANSTFFPSSTIYIFNRYGKAVAEIKLNEPGWDGTYNGKKLPSDDYWFSIKLQGETIGNRERKGHFSLIRR